ncbi:MAG TPA: hypothetical protein VMU25_04505 [Candidatus Paceibacterota bacterium]|nr:hypothetical protein [Candidatus Paceibacterota bacterium]
MESHRTVPRLLALIAAAVLAGEFPVQVLAGDLSSQSFIARDGVFDQGGGTSSSTSFTSVSTVGGTVAPGTSTSTSFQIQSGQGSASFSAQTQNWRWYDDETDETPTVALAAENVAPSNVIDQNIVKLRLTIKDISGNGASGVKFFLQFATSSDFANPVSVAEQGACTSSSDWCYADGAGVDNALISTSLLSDADSCTSGVGAGCGTHNESGVSTSSQSQAAGAATEYEFTIKESGAAGQTVYFFRPVLAGATTSVALAGGASYPSLATGGATLTFTINGLPAATSTGGVETSIDTTSTTVPFGTLTLGTSTIAAHRFTVTTNAGEGYQIFAYERQQLVDASNAEIPPVSATNDNPLGWSTACTATSTGCWGYHSDAPVLSGGSTRFAPDDTYAQFDSTAREIAYSAVPVTNQSTDVVYRVAATNLQGAGDYSSNLVYIIAPVF